MKFRYVTNLLSKHFPFILGISFLIGLVVPGLDQIHTHVITVLVALQIFCSCFKVEAEELRGTNIGGLFGFYCIRFVLMPVVVYFLMDTFIGNESYGVAIFLLFLLPAGVSAPAFTGIMGGSVSLALLLVVLSSLLSPFTVPGAFDLLTGKALNIEVVAMFVTMSMLVFLPLICHLPIRKMDRTCQWFRHYHAALVIPMVSGTIILAIAKQRQFLLSNWNTIFAALAVSFLIFLALYAIGWLFTCRAARKYQIAFVLSSGLNNISLGIVLSALYFDADVAIFMVVANISWVIAIVPIRRWMAVPA